MCDKVKMDLFTDYAKMWSGYRLWSPQTSAYSMFPLRGEQDFFPDIIRTCSTGKYKTSSLILVVFFYTVIATNIDCCYKLNSPFLQCTNLIQSTPHKLCYAGTANWSLVLRKSGKQIRSALG